jgi:hypothetical protein
MEQRIKELQPIWQRVLQERAGDLEEQLKSVEGALQKAKEADKAELTKRRDTLKANLDKLNEQIRQQDKSADFRQGLQDTVEHNVYASDAYHLLANLNLCLKCHEVSNLPAAENIGPSLNLTPDRLRPDWTQRWIASPQRLLVYPIGSHPMPQPFTHGKPEYQDVFAGTALEQATALRDILMMLPQVAAQPINRLYQPGAEAPK